VAIAADTLLETRPAELTGEVPPSRATAAEVTNSLHPGSFAVLEETNTEAARIAGRKITHTVASKVAMVEAITVRTKTHKAATDDRTTPTEAVGAITVNPTTDRTRPPRAVTDDRMTPMEETEALMVDLMTTRTKTRSAVMGNRTTRTGVVGAAKIDPTAGRTEAPSVVMGNRTIPTEAAGAVKIDPPVGRMETPKAATEGRTTPMGATEAVMVNRTTADPKIPTEAALPVTVDRTIILTEALREAMENPATTTILVPIASRNAVVDTSALEEGVMVPNETMTTALMTLVVIVQDTNPRTSHRRILTPLVPPRVTPPPTIRILLEEVTVEIVKRKPGTIPLAAMEAAILMEAPNKAAMVVEVIAVKAKVEGVIIKNTTMTRMTRPMVLRD